MNTRINKKKKIAVIGCGYWGTIITKTLIKLGFKNIYVYDSNIKNSNTLKKVKSLNLYRNYIKDEGSVIFANENQLEKIEDLDLSPI